MGEAKQREESRSVIALTPARVRGRQRGKGVVHTTGLGSSLRDPSRQHGKDRVPKKLGGVEISKLTKLAGSPITEGLEGASDAANADPDAEIGVSRLDFGCVEPGFPRAG